jgi:hypothetical protein
VPVLLQALEVVKKVRAVKACLIVWSKIRWMQASAAMMACLEFLTHVLNRGRWVYEIQFRQRTQP